jgi:hypothetical protein
LEILGQVLAHGEEGVLLEEPFPWGCLLQLADYWQPEQLLVLIGQAKHLREYGELAIHCPVRGLLPLAVCDVGGRLGALDPRDPCATEEPV